MLYLIPFPARSTDINPFSLRPSEVARTGPSTLVVMARVFSGAMCPYLDLQTTELSHESRLNLHGLHCISTREYK